MCLPPPELSDVSKQNRRRKVAFDVRLLERLDLAGEDMINLQVDVVLRSDGLRNQVQS